MARQLFRLWTILVTVVAFSSADPGLLELAATQTPSTREPAASAATGAAQYWCPMHPDERSDRRGPCPVCGMTMVRIPPARFVTYPVDLRATTTLAGVRLRVAVRHPSTQALVRRFATVHERPMHLFVVGDGLAFFTHEHPVQQPDGVFMIDLALPRPGPYMVIAEFLPDGGTPQMFQQAFTTGAPLDPARPPQIDGEPKAVDGMRVSVDTSKLRSGGQGTMTFRIADAATGGDISDLEPYLGAAAHLLMVPADLTEAVHAHPDGTGRALMVFTPIVPRPGRYKMWLQVQRRGRVATAPFVVDVP